MAFQEGSGTDVGWYFEELFEGTARVDWSVAVGHKRIPDERGFFLREGEYVETKPPEGEEDEDPYEDEEDEDDYEASEEDEDASWIYDVIVRRRGTLCLPLTIEVTFADDTVQIFQWTREMQLESERTWWRLPIPTGTVRVKRVILDPERRYYLDGDMSDNQWYAERDPIAPARWGERAFSQYLHGLHWFSSLGG